MNHAFIQYVIWVYKILSNTFLVYSDHIYVCCYVIKCVFCVHVICVLCRRQTSNAQAQRYTFSCSRKVYKKEAHVLFCSHDDAPKHTIINTHPISLTHKISPFVHEDDSCVCVLATKLGFNFPHIMELSLIFVAISFLFLSFFASFPSFLAWIAC